MARIERELIEGLFPTVTDIKLTADTRAVPHFPEGLIGHTVVGYELVLTLPEFDITILTGPGTITIGRDMKRAREWWSATDGGEWLEENRDNLRLLYGYLLTLERYQTDETNTS